jgi:16S rRNA (cytidine1402-2'-O)-methyltransferase
VATPIGNLGDVTARALEILKSADVVAAEDTRITKRLLDHYGIAARLIALHEHNEQRRAQQVLDLLAGGAAVALVSDAGTPAISDPGARLVDLVRQAGYPVSPLPGPNAAIAALSASGLEAPHFLFYGFLPSRRSERVRALQSLARGPYVLVFYEAPHRVAESMRDLRDVLGAERPVVLARELTKRFETIHRCTLADAGDWLEADPNRTRGEFVLLVGGAAAGADAPGLEPRHVLEVLLAELPVKQAVSLATRLTGGRRNELYDMALAIKGHEA